MTERANLTFFPFQLGGGETVTAVAGPTGQLLMIMALGQTVESFFALPRQSPPLNEGKWSRLNPFCCYYRKLHIDQRPKIGRSYLSSGIFAKICCACGFAYGRKLAPDTAVIDPNKWDRIENFGSVWLTGFTQLWSNPSLSIKEIAMRSGLSPTEVPSTANQLKLNVTTRLQELTCAASLPHT